MKHPSLQQLDVNCDCHDMMHRFVFEYDDEDMYLMMSPMMNIELPWWKRIMPAIRFALGIRNAKDWHYTDVAISHNMAEEIQKFIEQYKADYEAYWANHKDPTIPYIPIRGYTRKGHGD